MTDAQNAARPVVPEPAPATPNSVSREARALEIASRYGQEDGEHHKAWVIDQMVRALTGDKYFAFLVKYCDGEDGPDSYEWDEGIAP